MHKAQTAPNRFRVVQVLVMSGENVQDSVGASLVDLISTAPELQIYSVHKLFHALKAEPLTTIKASHTCGYSSLPN